MKTKKVRIALAIDPCGDWAAAGGEYEDDEAMGSCVEFLQPGEHRYWVEVEVPIPEDLENNVLQGKLTSDAADPPK